MITIGKYWTQSEEDFLKDNRGCDDAFLAERLGRSVMSVRKKKHRMKLCDSRPFMPEQLSKQEKEIRIIKMAADMRVKLKGW